VVPVAPTERSLHLLFGSLPHRGLHILFGSLRLAGLLDLFGSLPLAGRAGEGDILVAISQQ
jgi:hypothetical protein